MTTTTYHPLTRDEIAAVEHRARAMRAALLSAGFRRLVRGAAQLRRAGAPAGSVRV